ncbi:unnamed protein product, partial [Rotaria sp. Silwood1]
IVYYISTVSFPIYSIYLAITSDISKTTNRLAIESFMRYLALKFLIYINSCSIFYIHLLASKPFRQECKLLILRSFKRDQNKRTTKVASARLYTRQQLNRSYNRQPIE